METNTNFTTELKTDGESLLTNDVVRVPTIFNRNACLQIEKCSSQDCCGGLYHCPYCDPSVFKPTRATRTVDHIHLSHFPHAVYFKDLVILKCYQKCSKGGHYHCPVCSKLILKRTNFRDHLLSHIRSENKSTELVQTPNCRLPKKIELKDNNIELCEKACEDAVGKHYHCPVCKTRNFIDLGSTLSHVWRCSQQLKPKPRNSSHLVVTDNQQLSHPADCDQIKYHTSIVRSVSDIPVVRCQLEDCCGNKFHCQLCPVDKFKPNFYSHLLEHYNTHWKNRVEVDGYSSLICYLACQGSTNGGRTRYHFHCPFCGLIRRQRLAMTVHVEGCERRGKVNKEQSESTSVVPVADQSLPEILEEGKEFMKNQETAVDETTENDILMEEEEEEGIIDEPLVKHKTQQADDFEEKQQEKMSLSDKNQEMENNVPILVEEAEVSSPLISDNINPDNCDREIIDTLHQENKSTVDDVQNVKVFGTMFGLISERVQHLLCSDQDHVESCLNDIAKSSCTTLRWFTRDNRRLAALMGDLDSMVTAEKLFTTKILERQPEEKILTHKEENLNIANQEETFSEILQSFLSSNLSITPSKSLVSSPGTRKRGRPKKLKKSFF